MVKFWRSFVTVVALAQAVALAVGDSDPVWDHQTTTYQAKYEPVNSAGEMTITPFFSPYRSVDAILEVIRNAKSTLDVGTPGFSSWIGCTSFSGGSSLDGCAPSRMRDAETFPVFAELLNAAHRGVKVRLLTNDYGRSSGPGLIDPLQFLAMQGNVEVRYFRTLTFWHAKYLQADAGTPGARSSVSSVNFSHTSFMYNREAGMVIEGPAAAAVLGQLDRVFSDDFALALGYAVNQSYNATDLSVILNASHIEPPVPPPYSRDGYDPVPVPVTGTANLTVVISPDTARDFLVGSLTGARKSFRLYTYQVTDPALCDLLISRWQSGLDMTLLFSKKIFDVGDQAKATACYDRMHAAGVALWLTDSWDFEFSHQKYWVADGSAVFMSTGNWSPTDFPVVPPTSFPPHTDPGWRDTNRDFNIAVEGSEGVVSMFEEIMYKDLAEGRRYVPSSAP